MRLTPTALAGGHRRVRHNSERGHYILTRLWLGAAVPFTLAATDTR
jgi:hypothetical protein